MIFWICCALIDSDLALINNETKSLMKMPTEILEAIEEVRK